jgi:kumamolisin
MIRSAKVAAIVIAFFVTIGILLYLYGFNFRQVGQGPEQETYIVDRGLLRFAKFAGSVLAVFVTVGLFLYGFNLKEVAKEVREIAEKTQEVYRQATNIIDEIRKAKEVVASDRSESELLLKATREIGKEVEIKSKRLDSILEHGDIAISEFDLKFKSRFQQLELVSSDTTKRKAHPRASSRAYTVPQLAQLYGFPTGLDGRGQCIGLIELGGGYRSSDLKTYFNKLGIPLPKVTWESVDGGKNAPSGIDGPDGQVTLDIEVAGAVAPGAHIVVYFAPNTDDGFQNAVEQAIADKINRPSVLSISWGAPEAKWTRKTMTRFDRVLHKASESNITVVCAAGDNGATDGIDDGKTHVDFPSSSSWVLSCGGTSVTASSHQISSEVVWNNGTSGTGGGVSSMFPLPEWQARANVPARSDGSLGRGLPDVAAHADPNNGYAIYLHGKDLVLGGTAAATPLWAGLIALLNQGLERNIGFLNPVLYSDIGPAGVLRGVTEGNNDINGVKGYTAGDGWNPCAGWGSPDGKKLLEALRSPSRYADSAINQQIS